MRNGQSNPSSCVCGAAFLCTRCAPAALLLFDSICKTAGSILAAQEISGVFNVMIHSRHGVPKGALYVLLLESLRLEQE